MKKLLKILVTLLLSAISSFSFVACLNTGNVNMDELLPGKPLEILNKEVFDYGENGERIVYDHEFIDYGNDKYYIVNNVAVVGDYVVDGNVYSFNNDGAQFEKVITETFLDCEGSTYYVVNNAVLKNKQIINGSIYDFGSNGKMIKGEKDGYTYNEYGKLVGNDVFVEVQNYTYYMENDNIARGRKFIKGSIYDFGEDGKMVIGEKDGYTYGTDGKLIANEIFYEIDGDTYYFRNNVVVYDMTVIGGSIYNFGTDGKMVIGEKDGYTYGADGKLVADEEFVSVGENTYYIVNNVTVYNTYIIGENVYNFGEDGKMVIGKKDGYTYGEDGKLIADEIFVNAGNDTYYVEDNAIVYGDKVIRGGVYNFGSNGKMVIGEKNGYTYGEEGKLIADEEFVNVGGNTYYIVNNVTVYNIYIVDGSIYDFGEDGKMVTGEKDGYTYGADGKLVADEEFVTIGGNTYYIVNNVTVYNTYIIGGSIYNFGEDGKMVTGEKDGYTYGADGKLVADEEFVIIEGNTYYIVNNVTVYNTYVIGGYIYDFGTDGKMVTGTKDGYTYGADGKLVADEEFVTVGGNTYYIVNNVTVYNIYIVDGSIYDFGEDGKMVTGEKDGYTYGADGKLIADEEFVTVGGNTYYIVNNVTVYNTYVIGGYIYDFGTDGKMVTGEKDGYTYGADGKLVADEEFVTVGGNTYYIINNVTVYNIYIVDGSIYDFGEDGKMVTGEKDGYTYGADGKLIADEEFVTVDGNTYYIVNNVTVYNTYVIGGYIYDFGTDGKMVTGTKDGYTYGEDGKLIADEEFVTVGGNTYYIVNNVTVYNTYIIGGNIYDFGEDGKMVIGEKDGYTYGADGKLIANNEFVQIGGNTYYIINNVTVYNKIIINGYVYDFGEDGKMNVGSNGDEEYSEDGKLYIDNEFITIDGETYYMVDNQAVTNKYMIIDGRVYYFTESGARVENGSFGGYTFSNDGYITGTGVTITIDDVNYIIIDGYAYEYAYVSGKVYESDNDRDPSNNPVLANVSARLEVYGLVYTATTNASGEFEFGEIPVGESQLTFTLNNYITINATINTIEETTLSIVMDRQVSNNLSGTILIADTDSNTSNNSALAGATITLRRTTSTNVLSYQTTTNSYGNYSFSGLTAGVYELIVTKSGYITVTQYVQVRYNETNVYNLAIEAIPDTQGQVGYASGYVYDARTGSAISGLSIYVYQGINNNQGEHLCKVTTGSNGYYITEGLEPGNYTAYVVDERELSDEDYRYSSYPINIKILGGTTTSGQNATISNSIGMNINGMRIVLTWGSTPSDLDSHLTFGNSHVYYSNRNQGGCGLDVDDTSAYGPETITISSIGNYTYKYYVYNFSRSGTFERAQAVVTVYFGSSSVPAYTFRAPSGTSGYYWTLFTYNGVTGEFTVINRTSDSVL